MDTAGPVINVAMDNVVEPRQDHFPYPTASLAVSLEGIDHVGIDVPDLEAAERWYVQALGARILRRRGWGGGVKVAKPHTDIQIGPEGPGNIISLSIGEPTALNRGSSIHWALRCASMDELEAWKKHLDDVDVPSEIWAHYGCGAISAYLRDPWKNRFEIVMEYPDWPSAEKVARDRSIPVIGEGGKFPTV